MLLTESVGKVIEPLFYFRLRNLFDHSAPKVSREDSQPGADIIYRARAQIPVFLFPQSMLPLTPALRYHRQGDSNAAWQTPLLP